MISENNHVFTLENDFLARTVEISPNGLRTLFFVNKQTGHDYLFHAGSEYQFSVGSKLITGYAERQIREVDGNIAENTATPQFLDSEILLPGKNGIEELRLHFEVLYLRLTVHYQLPSGLPGMRKFLTFENHSAEIVRLDGIVWDNTVLCPGQKFSECEFFHGQEDLPASLCQTYNGNEDILRFHNSALDEGFFLATTAPGCLRYFLIYPNWNNLTTGYNMAAAPSVRYLKPGEKIATDSSLIAFYSGQTVTPLRDLIRMFLPPLPFAEGVMYCTWLPFLKNINETLVLELIAEAAELNFSYFVLDDGWFNGNDWAVDTEKFPNGLDVIEKAVHSAGMKFGLWFNIGTSYGAKTVDETTACRTADGQLKKLGWDQEHSNTIQCFGSAWRELMLKKLDEIAARYYVDYFKLDFSSIFSPYGVTPYGCHAHNHEHHRGFEDSIPAQYGGFRHLRHELKKRHSDLLIDYSFEAFGPEEPNIAALEYSELHHVSNISANNPMLEDITRVRQNFYRWSRLLPPERQMLGLLSIQGEYGTEYLLTSFIGAPLVAGDLRRLSPALRARIAALTGAFRNAAKDGALTEFEVVFNEAGRDGFRRFNAAGHGILCLFNRSAEPWDFSSGDTCVNVENGETHPVVPPCDCAMFRFCR